MRLFQPMWTQNVVCTSSNMVTMWLVWITPRYARAGTLRTCHNCHHATLGTQSTSLSWDNILLYNISMFFSLFDACFSGVNRNAVLKSSHLSTPHSLFTPAGLKWPTILHCCRMYYFSLVAQCTIVMPNWFKDKIFP